MAKDMTDKAYVSVLMELPIKVHARLQSRAHENDRSIKAEAERIVRLTVMGDSMDVPCVANRTTKQEG